MEILPVLCHPKNCQFHASLNPESAPLPMMISQPFGCAKSFVISIPTEIVKLTSREAKSILSHNLEMWLISEISSFSRYLSENTIVAFGPDRYLFLFDAPARRKGFRQPGQSGFRDIPHPLVPRSCSMTFQYGCPLCLLTLTADLRRAKAGSPR